MKILVLNSGSSTLKGTLFDAPKPPLPSRPPEPLWEAMADWGQNPGTVKVHIKAHGAVCDSDIPFDSAGIVAENVLRSIWGGPCKALDAINDVDAVGHRIVHGGKELRDSTQITAHVKAEIERLGEFAPNHNPLAVAVIDTVERIFGSAVPQVAIFDTSFHSTLPRAAAVYPGPYQWVDAGIERFGFHGISHRYTSRRAAEILSVDVQSIRIITCHLGNGCSLAAIREGRSVDTTMGFTPLEGLMMGTRSGSIDPGIIVYLLRRFGYTADDLDRILNKESGLKGLSGISGDMREILSSIEAGDERAKLAFDVYAHRLCREIGGMLATLGGVDVLVFTAGVGENCAPLREMVCRQLGFLGLEIDQEKNRRSPTDEDISSGDSLVRVLIVHTEEDWEIARECYRLNRTGP